ncbi:hypothetical protein H9Q69_008434 [Fusarium xylarioides]|uniref:Uncharacterized protein n=1 Tax=Fusarium xylarioides TaxID=221167 RepID=A0A9P7L5Q1_9HYPO|nr:hypothetical protein H9Q70_010306 [Fusarium xylarioides]KAG5761995.1 hypothetical protein H9Q72_009898 [Fusarium xylarioides]KAG5775675.1 hypothetical protein H9Q73_010652 [Fusarium xylarioides]KAG5792537.1 hypothetical protein H9Q69_008434 [Fusarium xylarioides]KAG5811763.1 hypothetical protein H9Q71_004674 [Fusarium xylarioides]
MAAAAHMQGNKSDEESIEGSSSDEEAPRPGEVRMGKFVTSKGARIYTTGLATCVRVAVTGRYPNGFNGDDRFLAHVAESKHKAALQGLIDAIERAKGNGLQVVGVVVVILAADEGSPDSGQDDFNEEVIDRVQNAAGIQPNIIEHTSDEDYKMSVEADKRINYAAE